MLYGCASAMYSKTLKGWHALQPDISCSRLAHKCILNSFYGYVMRKVASDAMKQSVFSCFFPNPSGVAGRYLQWQQDKFWRISMNIIYQATNPMVGLGLLNACLDSWMFHAWVQRYHVHRKRPLFQLFGLLFVQRKLHCDGSFPKVYVCMLDPHILCKSQFCVAKYKSPNFGGSVPLPIIVPAQTAYDD